ncbi:hypothetical protein STEG23_002448, partial [Scotinomys teguina]
FGDTCNSSPRGSKLPFQRPSSKFQREISHSFVSSHEKPDTYLSGCAMSKFGSSPVAELPQQAGNEDLVDLQERRQPTLSPVIERICFTHSKKTPQPLSFKEVDTFIGNSDSKKEIDLRSTMPQWKVLPLHGNETADSPRVGHLDATSTELNPGNANNKKPCLSISCLATGFQFFIRPSGVLDSICHGQDARTWMLQDEVPILKLLSIDGSAASAIM